MVVNMKRVNWCYLVLIVISLKLLSSCSIKKKSVMDTRCMHYFDSSLEKDIYTKVDKYPSYPKGSLKMIEDFGKEYKIPQDTNFQGTFYFEITIDDLGMLLDIAIKGKTKGDYSLSEKRALLAMKKLNSWLPGKCYGEPVIVKFSIVIRL